MKKISYRNATPEDWPAIMAFHIEQQQKQQSDFELPYLFTKQFPVVLVGEDEDGKLRNCFYCEAVAELRFVGCDPRATAFSQREADGLCYLLRLMGFRWLETYVPRRLAKMIGKPLKRAKFQCVDSELSHFTRDLREKL